MLNTFSETDTNMVRLQTQWLTLLKPINKVTILTPYEQLFIHTFHHNGYLITEEGTGEHNPLFQSAIDNGHTSATFPKPTNTPQSIYANQSQLFKESDR